MKSKCINKLQLTLPALSVNESAARAIVSAFCAQLPKFPQSYWLLGVGGGK